MRAGSARARERVSFRAKEPAPALPASIVGAVSVGAPGGADARGRTVHGTRDEPVAGERRRELRAGERVLIELAAAPRERPAPSSDPEGPEPARAVHVRGRDHEPAARRPPPARPGQGPLGGARAGAPDAARDV